MIKTYLFQGFLHRLRAKLKKKGPQPLCLKPWRHLSVLYIFSSLGNFTSISFSLCRYDRTFFYVYLSDTAQTVSILSTFNFTWRAKIPLRPWHNSDKHMKLLKLPSWRKTIATAFVFWGVHISPSSEEHRNCCYNSHSNNNNSPKCM